MKETGKELMIWKNVDDFSDLNYDEIMESFEEEMKKENLVPADLNWRGRPNIYLRGKYKFEKNEDGSMDESTKTLIETGFMMFVKELEF